MGIIKVARWKNAPPDGLELLRDTIVRGHSGKNIGLWRMHLHSYRSGAFPSRSIFAASTNHHTYAVIEDSSASLNNSVAAHPRISFVTIASFDSLGPMLSMIAGNWTASRTNAAIQNNRAGLAVNNQTQLGLDGFVYSIGTDWVVRIGTVRHGQAPKGVFIEVEYLPLKESPGSLSNAPIVAEFLSTFARKSGPAGETDILAVELDEDIWATVARSPDDLSSDLKTGATREDMDIDEDDDLFCTTESPTPPSETTSRERRSAFLILRCLQGEGLL